MPASQVAITGMALRSRYKHGLRYHFASLRTSVPLMHVMSMEGLRLVMCGALRSLSALSHQPSSFSVQWGGC